MKILLVEDVDNLGLAGDIKKVADGYGRNYLLPNKLAILATEGAERQAKTIRRIGEKRRAQATADAQAVANQLNGKQFVFERRAGETGKLYGSVTTSDIAEAIMEQYQIGVDRRKIVLHDPIRNLGAQEVELKLMPEVSATIKVQVIIEGGALEPERLPEYAAEEEAIAAAEEAQREASLPDDAPPPTDPSEENAS